ncbi:MAG: endopeptidase La [SAR86 cluster bacterium]|uniref:Lon protease n=1 Tax=SAR86 cluster bacterium TaxID=2030880 RepID=A0A838Y0S9_9GAMM|nr:endopeptidase La [SAR86 cluster bacterium]|tara:strand:- start:385 stop:2796 length:2412 start_codon:yes stop_codon:yes gene_type:complete
MANIKYDLPLIPLRDVVVFPGVVTTLFVGRNKSINALNAAMAGEKKIILAAQKDGSLDSPLFDDLYKVATIANILQMIKLPDGTVKVLVEGSHRAQMESLESDTKYSKVRASLITESSIDAKDGKNLALFIKAKFHDYIKITKKIAPEVLASIDAIDDLSRIIDSIAGQLPIEIKQKQEILEATDFQLRAEILISFIESQLDVMDVDKRIRNRVKGQMEKSQREYYLNEQIKAAQKELGDISEEGDEISQLEEDIAKAGMSKEAFKKANTEFSKFKQMSPMSAEASVVRSYLDWLTTIPWKKKSKVKSNLKSATEILNEDHFGLDEVKERILEYLAVQQRVKKLKAPVLCLVGPPGVGKTSLGKSIARATNRKFTRMSLGGVRDEAEIRGHRRTYIGSMPGKIIQKLSKVEVKNPLFLLDEIDKMGMDSRGDPASALLEVLDPEQNNTFSDHYLEVDFDLSEIMFVCTANSLNIPGPLLDRMEIIRLPGYIEDEKLNIAKQYLIPKQLERNGLDNSEVKLSDKSILDIVRYYTREAGVRGLERQIAKIFRKSVKERVLSNSKKSKSSINITPKNLEKYCGVAKFKYGEADVEDIVGKVAGLAWTEVGGELLTIESSYVPGKGQVIKTGSLGDVMQESIQAALTVVRSRSKNLGIPSNFYEKYDVHIHVPDGATPKDGPSAGVGMCTALISVFTGIPVRSDTAMTGEITLHGQVTKIGGLKEKLLAAKRAGIKRVIIPQDNAADLREIPSQITHALEILPVRWVDEAISLALTSEPKPSKKRTSAKNIGKPKTTSSRSSTRKPH